MIAGMAMLASSCTEQETAGLEGYGTRTVTFSATAGGQTQTRAGGAAPAVDGHTLKYYLQVLNGSGVQVGETQTSADGSFTVKLPTGSGTYDCLFWADYVPTSGGATAENDYFITTDLREVTLKKKLENLDKCQAFCAALNIDAGTVDVNHAVTLTRAVAQVNLRNSAAMDDFSKVVATYTNVPNKFNVLTGETDIDGSGVADHSFEVTDFTGVGSGNNYTFQSAYFLAPGTEESHMLKIKLETYSNTNPATPLQTLNLDNVPTKKNYKTNVTGAFQSATTTHTYSFAFASWDDEYYRPMSVWNGNAATIDHSSTFSGGEGTEANPYIIGSAADLAQLAANANDDTNPNSYDNKYFKLAIDIDLNNRQWTPISSFSGYLDGKQHEIKNMKIESDGGDSGLFEYLYNGAQVSNLHVSGDITLTDGGDIGGICGYASGNVLITNCSFQGNITGGDNTGGIIGNTEIRVIITCSRNSGTINGKNAGGIAGSFCEGVVAGCYNSGVVKTTEATNDEANIGYAGGIVGWQFCDSKVMGCYNIGDVEGVSGITGLGAICGKVDSDYNNSSESCYAKELYTNELGAGSETKFGGGAGKWPDGSSAGTLWYADTNNDGTFTHTGNYNNIIITDCKFWKSLGFWGSGVNPEYPKLWWEE